MATMSEITDFRSQTGLQFDDINDSDLSVFLDANGGLIPETAVAVLDRMATEAAKLVTTSESGSSRSLSDLAKNLRAASELWSSKTAPTTSGRYSTVSTAVRV